MVSRYTRVKQGCKISPTLFSIYINDLAQEIKRLNCGINLDGTIISVLLYADDIVLIAPTAENRQLMLDNMNSWCRKWKLSVNQDKTKVIHSRTASVNTEVITSLNVEIRMLNIHQAISTSVFD